MILPFHSIDLRAGAKAGSQSLTIGAIADGSGHLERLPVARPVVAGSMLHGAGAWRPLCVHNPGGSSPRLIAAISQPGDDSSTSIGCADLSSRAGFLTIATVIDASVTGAVATGLYVVLTTTSGLRYLLWRDNGYVDLGYAPPRLNVEFRLVNEPTSAGNRRITIGLDSAADAESLASRLKAGNALTLPASGRYGGFVDALSNEVHSALLTTANESITGKNRFWQPFFVRIGLRMADGSVIAQSPVQLMLPSGSHIPVMTAANPAVDTSSLTFEADIASDLLARCRLEMRLTAFDHSEFSKWTDLISAVEVAVSEGIATYDPNAPVRGFGRLDRVASPGSGQRPGADGSTAPGQASATTIMRGVYANASDATASVLRRRFTADELAATVWQFEGVTEARFTEQLTTRGVFHIVARITPDKITGYTEGFREIEMESGALASLAGRPLLPDGFRTCDRLIAGLTEWPGDCQPALALNGRITVAPHGVSLPPAPPVRSLLAFESPDTGSGVECAVSVRIVRDGQAVTVSAAPRPGEALPSPDVTPPIWIYVADPDATEVKLQWTGTDGRHLAATFALTRHQALNGAYHYGGLSPAPLTAASIEGLAADCGAELSCSPQLRWTAYGSVFDFSYLNTLMLPHSRVLAIAPATRAMSAGQFGEYPLYFFTEAGVGVTSCDTTGNWISPRMVSDEAPVSPQAITRVNGGAIAFAGANRILQISGSVVERIDSPVGCENTVQPLPASTAVDNILRHIYPGISPAALARLFPVAGSPALRLAYDPQRCLLYAFRPDENSCMAVWSARSNSWSVSCQSTAWTTTFVADSRLYVVANRRELHSFAPVDTPASPDFTPRIFTLSRPVSLPRGKLRRIKLLTAGQPGRRQSCVAALGSNDGVNWFPVTAATATVSEPLRGTPYRHHMIIAASDALPAAIEIT